MSINIGDKVRFLHEKGGGTVSGFRKGGLILVEDSDGFEIPMKEGDLVVIPSEKPQSEKAGMPSSESPQQNRPMASQQTSITGLAKNTVQLEERVEQLERMVQKLQRRIDELESANALRAHAKLSPSTIATDKKPGKDEIIEIDLHAHSLLDSTDGLSASEIKDYQMKIFREKMNEYLRDKDRRLVFIHGNGDGVLRKAILTELKYSYKTCRHQDASFQQYGFGATMVTIG